MWCSLETECVRDHTVFAETLGEGIPLVAGIMLGMFGRTHGLLPANRPFAIEASSPPLVHLNLDESSHVAKPLSVLAFLMSPYTSIRSPYQSGGCSTGRLQWG